MSWDTLLPILVILRLFVFDLWAIGPTRLRLITRTWPLSLEVMAPVTDGGRCSTTVYQVWSSYDVYQHYWAWWPWPFTLKLVCESHLRWGSFLPNLGTLGLEFSNYSLCTRRTDKSNAYCPFPTGGSVITRQNNTILCTAAVVWKDCKWWIVDAV